MQYFFKICLGLVLLLCASPGFAEHKKVVVLKQGITLTMVMTAVDARKHSIQRCGKESVCLIDGKPVFGSDGQMPKWKLQSMVLNLKGKKIPLDVSGMYEPWNYYQGKHYGDWSSFSITHSWADVWIVRGRFSDGAGSYQAQWLVSYGKSIRTLLMQSESLANLCGKQFCKTFK